MLRWRWCVPLLSLALAAGAAVADDAPVAHRETAWERDGFPRRRAMAFGDEYRRFLGRYKTEREVVGAAIAMARKRGHRDLFADDRPALRPGSRVYAEVHGKQAALIVVGTEPLDEGIHVVASHVDAVRIDLKQKPLYADGNVALLETHYYGDIKGYQWLSEPLELRGVVVERGGERVNVSIGDEPDEPVLVIPDAAIHIREHVDDEEGEQVPGERLDPIVSSTPSRRARGQLDPFAAEAARLLEEHHGVTPDDLLSAELELVPAGAPRDVGVDRAMVGGYAQDDRACSYAAVRAILAADAPEHTAVVLLVDKEEIGSTGNTGARSVFLRRVVAELLESTGTRSNQAVVDRVLSASRVVSADVVGAVNPHYTGAYEAKNASFAGSGVVWQPTASNAGIMAYVRGLLTEAGVTYQTATWMKSSGSVDETDTMLHFFTRQGFDGVDLSIPLLSMHAPFEVVSKADLFEAYRTYRAFLED